MSDAVIRIILSSIDDEEVIALKKKVEELVKDYENVRLDVSIMPEGPRGFRQKGK